MFGEVIKSTPFVPKRQENPKNGKKKPRNDRSLLNRGLLSNFVTTEESLQRVRLNPT
jgi:hypothetical protein